MGNPYRQPGDRFAEGDRVMLVQRGAVIVGRSTPLGGAWRVQWPSGLITTELDDELEKENNDER